MNTRRAALLLLATLSTTSACRKKNNPEAPQNPAPNANGTSAPVNNGAGTAPSGPTVSGQQNGESSVRSVPPTPATGCPALTPTAALGPGTVHNATINTNETWTLEGSPHRFPEGADISQNATVTVAPCAVVLVGAGYRFNVGEGGALLAVGDAQHPIRIGSDKNDAQPGDWSGVSFVDHARQSSRLSYVTIEHGGYAGSGWDYAACLNVAMSGLDLQHVTLRACRAFGAFVDRSGSFSDTSTDLTVKEVVAGDASQSGSVVFIEANSVRTLPQGTYTGNALNEIFVREGRITTSATWRNPGVRYHIADDAEIRVEGPTSPVLTIAPSTVIAMGSSANLTVGWDAEGGLIADGGNEAGRITFTGAATEPNAGSWEAIYLGARVLRARTKLAWVNIAYAGGDSGYDDACSHNTDDNDAALYVSSQLAPDAITHVTFTGLPEHTAAIARAWTGSTAVNFAAPALANDFSHTGNTCRQTPMRTADGCPDPARCD